MKEHFTTRKPVTSNSSEFNNISVSHKRGEQFNLFDAICTKFSQKSNKQNWGTCSVSNLTVLSELKVELKSIDLKFNRKKVEIRLKVELDAKSVSFYIGETFSNIF